MNNKSYLVCYDICNEKRLKKVHKVAVHFAVPLQYSVYYALVSTAEYDDMINQFIEIIDAKEDDIRIYPVWGTTLADWPRCGRVGGDEFLLIT